jgi:hypothetical protein
MTLVTLLTLQRSIAGLLDVSGHECIVPSTEVDIRLICVFLRDKLLKAYPVVCFVQIHFVSYIS